MLVTATAEGAHDAVHRDDYDERTAAEEREVREAALDETIAASFPASDPLSTDPNPDSPEVRDRVFGDNGPR